MNYGNIFQWEKIGDLGTIRFNVADRPMNTWTEKAIDEFYALLGDLEKSRDTRGLVIVPLLSQFVILDLHNKKVPTYLVG